MGRIPTTGCLFPALQPAFRQRIQRLGEPWFFMALLVSKMELYLTCKRWSKNFEFLPQFAFWKLGKENSFKIDYLMTRSQTHEKNI